MSAPAPARRPTRGYFSCPNSLAENQALPTPAERALALIVFRRDPGSPISDEHWTRWTGLEPRSKQYAIAGLRKKGLEVQGEGDKAKYTFHRHHWDSFVRTAEREEKPRTTGRAVAAAPGAKVHPECRAHGCSRLHVLAAPVDSIISGDLAQPVARSASPNEPVEAHRVPPSSGGKDSHSNEERARANLGALRSAFPIAAVVSFVLLLLAAIRRRSPGLPQPTDDELAAAVEYAWSLRKRTQRSEALFFNNSRTRRARCVRIRHWRIRRRVLKNVRMRRSSSACGRGRPLRGGMAEGRARSRQRGSRRARRETEPSGRWSHRRPSRSSFSDSKETPMPGRRAQQFLRPPLLPINRYCVA